MMNTQVEKPAPALQISWSRLFTQRLGAHRASLALSTYQAGKVFLIGLKPVGTLSVFERIFER